ncbi:MAG: hypothetical protein WAN20_14885 [Pseudonocardiaceae bacterium]
MPAAAAALAAGQIGTGQPWVITETIAALPASVPPPARDRAETDLARDDVWLALSSTPATACCTGTNPSTDQ